jgi:hypothetical protein
VCPRGASFSDARDRGAIRASPAFDTNAERAAGYPHLARTIIQSIETGVLQDPDFPNFRILDFWLRTGGGNPDQRDAFSPIRGGEPYRIWGRRRPLATRAEVAAGLHTAAAMLEKRATTWPVFVQERYDQAAAANGISPPCRDGFRHSSQWTSHSGSR